MVARSSRRNNFIPRPMEDVSFRIHLPAGHAHSLLYTALIKCKILRLYIAQLVNIALPIFYKGRLIAITNFIYSFLDCACETLVCNIIVTMFMNSTISVKGLHCFRWLRKSQVLLPVVPISKLVFWVFWVSPVMNLVALVWDQVFDMVV